MLMALPPEDVAKLMDAGVAAVVHKPSTPQELSAFLRRESDKWTKVVKASGAKAE